MDTDKMAGEIITFYSYKGGTGRSMALANVACLLAQREFNGKGVLMVDWDLEAPGLHRYFRDRFKRRVAAGDNPDRLLDSHLGLIDLFRELDVATQEFSSNGEEQTEEAARSLVKDIDLDKYVLKTDIPSLYLLKAGRLDEEYPLKVNTFDWESLYGRSPWLMRSLGERLAKDFHYVLIDSRTGVTDTSGISTMLMPERLVVVFTPNLQSLMGLDSLIRKAAKYRSASDDLRPLTVFPLASRVEMSEPDRRQDWRFGNPSQSILGYQPLFENLFKEVYDLPKCDLGSYFDQVQIPHFSRYAYGEDIAVLVELRGDSLSLTQRYESFAKMLVDRTVPWDLDRPIELESIGGEQSKFAEAVFARFTAEEQDIAQRLFTRLVRPALPEEGGEDGPLRIRTSELDPAFSSVLSVLGTANLVYIEYDKATGEETVQLANVQLLRGWRRLQTWIEQDRPFLVWRQRMRAALINWRAAGRDTALLMRGSVLVEAQGWLAERYADLNQEEREFIQMSQEQQAGEEETWKSPGLHAFVAMPFGMKDGIDFNRVYQDYINPALESASFEVFRADEEMRAGVIRTDMFQELLIADLVVVDLSIDNPNVWYELGVRHALRARGVIQIMCRRDYTPFDGYTDRSLRYHIKENSPGSAAPDPERIEDDKKKLAQFATETINAWRDRRVSPVYHLLPYLKEPDWKSLRVEEAKEFWEGYGHWAMRIEIARKGNRPGDILVLAEEAPNIGLRIEAYRSAGNVLRSLGQFALALSQYERALALAPDDFESRRQRGLLLGRLRKNDAAKDSLQDLVKDVPDDAESWALLGRVEKDSWISGWRGEGKTVEQMQQDAAADDGVLQEAIDAYVKGFRKDPAHYYTGINAVGLMYLLAHLTGNEEQLELRKEIEGGVRWAVRGALERDSKDYWARATLAELEGFSSKKEIVEAALKSAVAVADKDWFKLNSSREQLLIYKDLGFRPAEVQSCLEIVDRALARVPRPETRWVPRQVLLFSGHMVDAPDRKEPRFPPDKEPIAAKAIADKLDALGAGAEDLALCGGACGGDLLFAEACLARGLKLELRIPFDEPTFIQKSVAFAPGHWIDRFYQVKSNPNTKLFVMPDELGPTLKGANPYHRGNLWQVYTALCWGPDKVRFICLWNRKGGDDPGGTEHMFETVQKYSGRVYVLDTNVLW